MEFRSFLKDRREELGISQAQLADLLSDLGEETSSARVGHWETGRNKPPLEDANFRRVLATAMRMEVNEMMALLGFIITDDERSEEALRAAAIVDNLPQEARELALDYLSLLEKRFRSRRQATEPT